MEEKQVRAIVKKVLDEEHLAGFVKIFEKEHNLFRGSHDKIGLPEDLNVHQKITDQIIEGLTKWVDVYKHIGGLDDPLVDTEAIADAAIETAKIAALAVEEAQIAVGAATGAKIAAGAITVTKIGTNAVETPKIKAGAIEAAKIATGAVEAVKIAAGAVVADKIATGAVTTIKLNALAVTAAKIAALTITAGKIAANAIETDKINALAVTAAKIAAGTITASKIDLADFMNLPSDEDLVRYWSFDEGTGTLVVDGSGHEGNGTLINTEASDWKPGISGKCVRFSGTDEYLSIDAYTFTANHTICMWVQPLELGSGTYNSLFGNASTKNYLRLRNGDEETHFTGETDTQGDAVNFDHSAVPFVEGTWYFLVVTQDGSKNWKLYINGVYMDDVTTTNADLIISYIARGYSSNPWTGRIDEVRIYDRVLSTDEIKALYLYPAGNKSVRISGGQIEADTITAAQILAGSITADEILAGTITADELILGQRQHWYSIPSDTTRNSNTTQRSTSSGTYVKLKEIKVNEATGKMRIYFQIASGLVTEWVWGKIYKNGSPIGTERACSVESFLTFTEDLGPFDANDLIQIYAKGNVACFIKNFRFKYNRAVSVVAGMALTTPLPTDEGDHVNFSMTSQDP